VTTTEDAPVESPRPIPWDKEEQELLEDSLNLGITFSFGFYNVDLL
jgi:hypothetical protein